DARPPLREPEAPAGPGPPRLRREARSRRRAVRQRAGRARPRRTDPRGLLERRAERRERHADLLHQWCEARRFVRGRAPAPRSGGSWGVRTRDEMNNGFGALWLHAVLEADGRLRGGEA